jgi:hypothetical protein
VVEVTVAFQAVTCRFCITGFLVTLRTQKWLGSLGQPWRKNAAVDIHWWRSKIGLPILVAAARSIQMPFYKSRNATMSERLTGISNEDGFEAARKLVQSGRLGVGQKEADSWLQIEWNKRNGLKVGTPPLRTVNSSGSPIQGM